jgi:hypothetical protein
LAANSLFNCSAAVLCRNNTQTAKADKINFFQPVLKNTNQLQEGMLRRCKIIVFINLIVHNLFKMLPEAVVKKLIPYFNHLLYLLNLLSL